MIRANGSAPDMNNVARITPADTGRNSDNTVVILASKNLDDSASIGSQNGANSAILVSVIGEINSKSSNAAAARHRSARATKDVNAKGNAAFEMVPIAYLSHAGNSISSRKL